MENQSIISKKANLDESVKIGRFCIIEENVTLDENVEIGDFSLISVGSKIGKGTKVGTYAKIGKYVSIGSECSFTSFCEIRDNCVVGNRVKMGSRCTLSAGTVVEEDVNIKYSFVATDTVDISKNDIKLTVTLKKGSMYGANVTILPGVTIGEMAEIGACSQVRHDVPDYEIWYGNPATYFKTRK